MSVRYVLSAQFLNIRVARLKYCGASHLKQGSSCIGDEPCCSLSSRVACGTVQQRHLFAVEQLLNVHQNQHTVTQCAQTGQVLR